METAIRRDMILDVEVVDLLNHQITMEQQASSKYLAMALGATKENLEIVQHTFISKRKKKEST